MRVFTNNLTQFVARKRSPSRKNMEEHWPMVSICRSGSRGYLRMVLAWKLGWHHVASHPLEQCLKGQQIGFLNYPDSPVVFWIYQLSPLIYQLSSDVINHQIGRFLRYQHWAPAAPSSTSFFPTARLLKGARMRL